MTELVRRCLNQIAAPQLRCSIPRVASKTVATHVSIDPLNHYLGRHEGARLSRIRGAGHFVFSPHSLGLRYVRRAGLALLSRKRRLPIKSTAMRTHPQSAVGSLFFRQLSAYCAVCFFLPYDQRTISDVAMVRIRLGGADFYRNGITN